MDETFVFNEVEVRKTGRFATKELLGGKTLTLFEVTPVHTWDGTWKKWANHNALLVINGIENSPV